MERRRGEWATGRMDRDDEERNEWGVRQLAVQNASQTKAYILVDGELAAVHHAQFAHLPVVDLADMQLPHSLVRVATRRQGGAGTGCACVRVRYT